LNERIHHHHPTRTAGAGIAGLPHYAGATESEIANASAILLALAKDVEAESGLNWADTWLALKSRLPGYLQEA